MVCDCCVGLLGAFFLTFYLSLGSLNIFIVIILTLAEAKTNDRALRHSDGRLFERLWLPLVILWNATNVTDHAKQCKILCYCD